MPSVSVSREAGGWEGQHLSKAARGCSVAEAQSLVAENDRP